MKVDLLISRAPELDLPVSLTMFYSGLLVKIRQWVVACLAALLLLPSNFANIDKLLKQTAALTTDINADWSILLAACQGDATPAAHADCFLTFANLAGAP